MKGETCIVNLGDLSKPATALIEKIAQAVGAVFEPYQIVRLAKAEAQAERIRAESRIEITDIQRRALHRFIAEEARKQENMEQIIREAVPHLKDTSEPGKVEDDWIANFFDKCRLISDADMRALWSKILAGEANAPGSFSKRTVNFLSDLDKTDAELFTRLCTFVWMIDTLRPLVVDARNPIYAKHGIVFGSLMHLQSIGLIQCDDLRGFRLRGLPKNCAAFYYGQPTVLEFPKESDNEIQVGKVLLTKIGQELAPTCGAAPDPEFRAYILGEWAKQGYV